jgi:hypothetical protein
MFSQRDRVETLVPPNLTTTHGAVGAGGGAVRRRAAFRTEFPARGEA